MLKKILIFLFFSLPLFGKGQNLNIDASLSFSVDVKGYTNGGYLDAIPDPTIDNKFYLSFEDFAQQMLIKIDTSEKDLIKGYFINPKNDFLIDINKETIVYKNKTLTLSNNDFSIIDNTFYLSSDILAQLFNLKFTINGGKLTINITSQDTLPTEILGSANEKRQYLLGKEQAKEKNTNIYTQDKDYFKAPSIDLYQREYYSKDKNIKTLNHTTGAYISGVFLNLDTNLNTVTNYSSTKKNNTKTPTTTSANLLFTKNNAGNLKYGFNYLSFGDTSSYKTPLIDKVYSGLGFNITSLDQYNLNFDRTITIDGSIPDNYDIELYQNDLLIAVSSSKDGRYIFKNVPVSLGLNNFKLVFYSPFGEKIIEEKSVYIDSNPVKKNKFGFKMSTVNPSKNIFMTNKDQEINKFVTTATLYYGLTDSFTLNSSYSLQPLQDNKMTSFFQFGALFSIGSFSFNYNLAGREKYKKIAQDISIYGTVFKTSNINLTYTNYNGLLSNQSLDSNQYMKDQITMRYNDYFFRLPVELGYKMIQYDTNIENYSLKHQNALYVKTGKTLFSYFYVALEDNFVESNTYTTNQMIFYLDFNISNYTLKANASKDFHYKEIITSSNISLDYHFSDIVYSFFSVNNYYIGDTRTNYALGLSYNTIIGSLNLSLGYANQDSYNVAFTYSISVGYDKNRSKIYTDSKNALTSSAIVIALVFIDNNNNNIYDKGIDEPIENANLLIDGIPNKDKLSDKHGEIYIKSIPQYSKIDIELDTGSISDVMLIAKQNIFHKILRPAVSTYLYFPLVRSGDLEGFITIPDGINIKKYKTYIKNKDTNEVIVIDVLYSGSFLLEKVPYGKYDLIIEDEKNTIISNTNISINQDLQSIKISL